ncbi:uncharacterized protein LOC103308705 isoform X2 [Acyrthosiphon pisum]|uniref:Transposable element P transposase-like RNase H domain-containing protein n=1 Tax=Acyrthosiphon pisum TaxID=7029 RepID=A0A8R2JX57_ACYPI|nr:uncharacterized protein LOC103308705 isoform X2 [Acyrthosiphon pisum]
MSRNCFVPGCREGYKSKIKINKWQGIIKTTMFKAPKDLLLLEKWVKAIPRADRELRPGIDSVFIRNKLINITCTSVTCIEDITKVLKIVDDFVMCPGTGIDNCPKSDQCCEHINLISLNQVRNPRCTECAKKRKYFMDTQRVFLEQINEKPTTKPVLKNVLRINKRLNIKVTNLQAKVGLLKQQCAEASAKSIEEAIIEMPENQQEAVRACFAAAKKHNVKGNRYTINWIYECLLIRIKSKKVYEHLRSKNILTLPCVDTLQKYIQKMSSQYGFQQATFDILKKKSSTMKPEEKRGTLLLDEMKLSESVSS